MDTINVITNTYSRSIKAVDTRYRNTIYSTGIPLREIPTALGSVQQQKCGRILILMAPGLFGGTGPPSTTGQSHATQVRQIGTIGPWLTGYKLAAH